MLLGVDAFIVKIDVTKKNPCLLEILKFMRSAGHWIMDVAVGSSEIESVDVGLWPPNLIFTLMSDHAMC